MLILLPKPENSCKKLDLKMTEDVLY